MTWMNDNLGMFSILISLVVVVAGLVGFVAFRKALADSAKDLSEIQERRIGALKDEITACRAEAMQFKRWKGTLRYAFGQLGFRIIDTDEFITIVQKDSKKTHTVRMKTTVDEQVKHLDEDESEE